MPEFAAAAHHPRHLRRERLPRPILLLVRELLRWKRKNVIEWDRSKPARNFPGARPHCAMDRDQRRAIHHRARESNGRAIHVILVSKRNFLDTNVAALSRAADMSAPIRRQGGKSSAGPQKIATIQPTIISGFHFPDLGIRGGSKHSLHRKAPSPKYSRVWIIIRAPLVGQG